jgi:hypothetical protein
MKKKGKKGTGSGPLTDQDKVSNQPSVKMGAHQEAVGAAFQKAGFSLQDFIDTVNGLPIQQILALAQMILNAAASKKG